MKSFFSQIQSYFEGKAASYGGRYVELILRELAIAEPQILVELFPGIDKRALKRCGIKTEWRFDDGNRIADLAILPPDSDTPLALVEIKYDDEKQKHNAGQLSDYISYCRNNRDAQFLYLTQHIPSQIDINRVHANGHRHLLFSQLATRLENARNRGPLTKLFLDFLRDKGLCMEDINQQDLYALLVRLFNPSSGQRVHKHEAMVRGIPDVFAKLMLNMNIIVNEIRCNFDDKIIKRQPAIDFFLKPWYAISETRWESFDRCSNNKGKRRSVIPEEKERNGGYLYIYATSSLGDSMDWLAMEYGFGLGIGPGEPLWIDVYSQLMGNRLNKVEYEKKSASLSITVGQLSKKDVCVRKMMSAMKGSLAEVLRPAISNNLKRSHIRKLQSLKKAISSAVV